MPLNGSREGSVKVDIDATVIAELHEAQKRGLPLKAIAFDAGIKTWRLYEIAEGKTRIAASELVPFMEATSSDVLLHTIAHARGYLVFRVRQATGDFADLYGALTRTMQELGDVARTQEDRLRDGELSPDDALAIGRELDDLISAAAAMKDLALRKANVGEARR